GRFGSSGARAGVGVASTDGRGARVTRAGRAGAGTFIGAFFAAASFAAFFGAFAAGFFGAAFRAGRRAGLRAPDAVFFLAGFFAAFFAAASAREDVFRVLLFFAIGCPPRDASAARPARQPARRVVTRPSGAARSRGSVGPGSAGL